VMLSQHTIIFFHSTGNYIFIRGTVSLVLVSPIISVRDSSIIVFILSSTL
jgi:hypothetical protein